MATFTIRFCLRELQRLNFNTSLLLAAKASKTLQPSSTLLVRCCVSVQLARPLGAGSPSDKSDPFFSRGSVTYTNA